MSKDEATEILNNRGYDAEVKSGVVIIYYTGQLEPFSKQVHTVLKEIGYNMSFALTAKDTSNKPV